jgi:hypothetical protein
MRWWLVMAAIFVLSLPAVTPRLYASDEIEYFAYLRSLWFDQDLSFDNEYRHFYESGIAHGARPREDGTGFYGDRFAETFLEATTPTGLRPNFAPIGSALLWAPFYAAADLTTRIAVGFGSQVPADGYSRPYLVAVTTGSAVYGFLAVVLSVLVARRLVGTGHLAAFVTWVGTPLLFYMYVSPGMSHASSAFAVAAFVAVWLSVRRHWSARGFVALGCLAALMAMVREQDLFIVVGPAVDFLTTGARRYRSRDVGQPAASRLFLNACLGAAAFAVTFIPQAAAYLVLNGRLWPSDDVARKMVWTAPYATSVLFSPEHGLLLWTPLAAIGVVGLTGVSTGRISSPHREGRWLAAMLLLMFLAQVYVSGSVESWSAAGTFGHRRFVGLTVVLAVGVAAFVSATRTRWLRYTAAMLVVLCVWWNVALMAQFGAGIMNRQRLELGKNAYHSLITVPRLVPELVYRYLFDRESFYQSRSVEAPPAPAQPRPAGDRWLQPWAGPTSRVIF